MDEVFAIPIQDLIPGMISDGLVGVNSVQFEKDAEFLVALDPIDNKNTEFCCAY